jgi:hypothetical protein
VLAELLLVALAGGDVLGHLLDEALQLAVRLGRQLGQRLDETTGGA